jgi:transcription elongation factor Elf1
LDEKLTYEQEVALVIDSKYNIDEQIAILRQKEEKPDEYQAFFDFCEEVKRKVKESRDETQEEPAKGK